MNLNTNNRVTKTAAYKTLVRPNLEYCATVWSPYTTSGKLRIEMVQRRAARYATNRYHNTSSVTDMLQDPDWESQVSRRVKIQLTLLFKVIQDLVDIYQPQLISRLLILRQESITRKNLRFHQSQMPTSTVSSREPSQFGTLCWPLWPRPLTWFPSSKASPLLHFKLG